jgi:hypothetical protein
MRVTAGEYGQLELRAHSLLADVPLHDVWAVDLPGGRPRLTLLELRDLLSAETVTKANPAVRFLFALRAGLGRVFGWDREPPQASRESYLPRLSAEERERSLVAPGTPEGPFQALYVSRREAISEVQNATVHGFSVFALVENPTGYRLYWAIYVRPVGRIGGWYMRLIDPFRRWIIYPAILRRVAAGWASHFGRSSVRAMG